MYRLMFAIIVCINKFDLLFESTIFKAYNTLIFPVINEMYANCSILETFRQEVNFAIQSVSSIQMLINNLPIRCGKKSF